MFLIILFEYYGGITVVLMVAVDVTDEVKKQCNGDYIES
jgi:hypothetical protein